MFVCVSDAFVKLLLELVLFRVGIGIADAPKVLDELFSLVVSGEFFPRVTLRLRQDQIVVIDPFNVGLLDLAFDLALFFVRTGILVVVPALIMWRWR